MAHNDGCNTALALLFDKNLSVNLFHQLTSKRPTSWWKIYANDFVFNTTALMLVPRPQFVPGEVRGKISNSYLHPCLHEHCSLSMNVHMYHIFEVYHESSLVTLQILNFDQSIFNKYLSSLNAHFSRTITISRHDFFKSHNNPLDLNT